MLQRLQEDGSRASIDVSDVMDDDGVSLNDADFASSPPMGASVGVAAAVIISMSSVVLQGGLETMYRFRYYLVYMWRNV